jgi:hypothetical protein
MAIAKTARAIAEPATPGPARRPSAIRLSDTAAASWRTPLRDNLPRFRFRFRFRSVTVSGSGRLLRVVRTRYLSELVVRGATLDEQTDDLTTWASNALRDIFTLQPPGRELSKP